MPVACLRTGIRSVPLCNSFGVPLELARLLVKIEIEKPKVRSHACESRCDCKIVFFLRAPSNQNAKQNAEDKKLYESCQILRQRSHELSLRVEESERLGNQRRSQEAQSELADVHAQLIREKARRQASR